MIDLRSDTVTKPTPAMRRAMAEAEVGDDVYREDPTVRRLEERAAQMLGKEAALFVPTGSMGNTIGIKLHTRHGQEVVCDDKAHVLDWELAMMAWFSGCVARAVPTDHGILSWEQIQPVLRAPGGFNAATAAVSLEHPHNMGGGTLYAMEALDEINTKAHDRGLRVHMDGARLFNAVAASGLSADRIVRDVDTVNVCLSKGLGAPVGSLLFGESEAMQRARIYRKHLGGGMRQAGVLAAAGLVALDESPAKLHEDHANAKLLAERVGLNPAEIDTNIVIFDIAHTGLAAAEFIARAKEQGVLVSGIGGTRVRAVTHYDVTRQDCERAAEVLGNLISLVGTKPSDS